LRHSLNAAACSCVRIAGVDIEHERWAAEEREHGYVRARLRLLSSSEGGRQGAIATGYRSHWAFPPEVHHERHDGPLTLESGQWLDPGNETTIRLHPLFPDLWPNLVPGTTLTMLEGARVVGYAEVLAVAPPTA
jgi:hypothetical protein